ncbi:hypothetical protein [Streptomyces sp. NPDC058953]|uniref:hypothetical protein n=1 Tax=unclassified Streptomyces TaxID=2593676 RepID=UPI0036AF3B26
MESDRARYGRLRVGTGTGAGTGPAAATGTSSAAGRSRGRLPLAGTAAVGALLLAAASGCAGSAAVGTTAEPDRRAAPRAAAAAEQRPAPLMVTRPAGDPGALYAALVGTLVVTPERCVAVQTEPPGQGKKRIAPTPIAWAHGWTTRWENGKAAVYDADGKRFALEGQRVSLGGGGTLQYADHPCVTESAFAANAAQAGGA